jgi:hypothetical protein
VDGKAFVQPTPRLVVSSEKKKIQPAPPVTIEEPQALATAPSVPVLEEKPKELPTATPSPAKAKQFLYGAKTADQQKLLEVCIEQCSGASIRFAALGTALRLAGLNFRTVFQVKNILELMKLPPFVALV